METLFLIQIKLLGLLLICLSIGLYVLIKNIKKINNQQQKLNQTLEDIARSQRILANNPRDFEETKRISQNKRELL
jgi:predicted Holliday junction resolvase-like endonuclease